MNEGYFVIARSLLEHEIWVVDKPFTKGQAWVDLIGRANWKRSERMVGAELIRVQRGQLLTSEGALAERWGWSRRKVQRFLKMLENAGMVSKKGTAKGTTITVENYSKYQLQGAALGTASEQRGSSSGAGKGSLKNKDKNNKKGNNARAGARPPGVPDDWEEAR